MGTTSRQLYSDSTFRLLVNQITDYAIFFLTPAGYVASWNPGAERIKGYTAKEIVGQHFSIFYPAEEAQTKPPYELEVAARTGRFEDEGWRLRKDGSRFWANVIITAIRDDDGELIGFGKVTRDLTERRNNEQQLVLLSGVLLKTQDEERKRLGRELHDTVGQYLVAVKMALDEAINAQAPENRAREQISDATLLVDRAIREVRTLSYLLYPPMLEETGLASAFRWHLEGFAKRSGIEVASNVPDDLPRLSSDIELALFRVFQESLTNVLRHSGSKVAQIRFNLDNGNAILEISDQGKGMPVNPQGLSSDSVAALGIGVRGMHERIRQLGGQLQVNSSPQGTTVRAVVPIRPENAV